MEQVRANGKQFSLSREQVVKRAQNFVFEKCDLKSYTPAGMAEIVTFRLRVLLDDRATYIFPKVLKTLM